MIEFYLKLENQGRNEYPVQKIIIHVCGDEQIMYREPEKDRYELLDSVVMIKPSDIFTTDSWYRELRCPILRITSYSPNLSDSYLQAMVVRTETGELIDGIRDPELYAVNDTLLIDPSAFSGLFP